MYHISADKRSINSADLAYKALKKLLQTRSFKEINVTDIVKSARIGRATFYRCFDSIEDILRYRCDQAYIQCGNYLLQILLNDEIHSIDETFILPFLNYWDANSEIIELIIQCGHENFINTAFVAMIESLRKVYPEVDIPNYNYFIAMRSALATAVLIEWVKSGKDLTPQALSSLYINQRLIDMELLNQSLTYVNSK
ncbi:TetR/AcrR family transcriptional regulator [Fusibacter bizertensis]